MTHRALNLYGINVKAPQYLMLNGLTYEAYEEEYGGGPHAGDRRRPTLVQALRIYGKLRRGRLVLHSLDVRHLETLFLRSSYHLLFKNI